MRKVLYLKTPGRLKSLHKSIKGKRLFKGIWGSYQLNDYVQEYKLSLIVLTEADWKLNQQSIKSLPQTTKLVVLSNHLDVLESADGIITETNIFKTKNQEINLSERPQDFYLWALGDQVLSKCCKCNNLVEESCFQCDCCGSCSVEIAQAKNLIS